MRKILSNANGFSLMELMVATALIGLLSFGVMQMTTQTSLMKTSLDTADTALRLRAQILSELENETSWSATLAATENTSFNCINQKTDCTPRLDPAADNTFALYGSSFSATDTLVPLTGAAPGIGFDRAGRPCTTYVAPPGNSDRNCIYRYEARWTPVCPVAPPCISPQILVTINFRSNTNGLEIADINPEKYKIVTYRNESNGFAGLCAKVGGVYDPATKRCSLPLRGKCPFGTVLGANPIAKTKICGVALPNPVNCPAGQKFMGIDEFGVPFCIPVTSCTPACTLPPPICCVGTNCDGPPNTDGGNNTGGDGGCDGSDGGCK